MNMQLDLALVIATVGIGVAMIGVVITMMFWVMQESNTLRSDAKEDRKGLINIVKSIESEIRDFHFRLLEIERSKK